MSGVARNKRRQRNYIGKVEAELRAIYRHASYYTDPEADVTPSSMVEIQNNARRALEALGWEVRR